MRQGLLFLLLNAAAAAAKSAPIVNCWSRPEVILPNRTCFHFFCLQPAKQIHGSLRKSVHYRQLKQSTPS